MRYRAGASPGGRAFAVAALMLMAASGAHACFDSCRATEYKPVCSDDKMWYNPCYMVCEMGPSFAAYSACLPPPPCDPRHYPYKNLTYYSSDDCRTYTLFDVDAGCMPDWKTATDYCTKLGLDLAPWDHEGSNGALQVLVAGRHFTSWVGGKTPEGLCGVMTQEGRVVFQGCNQHARFVCRSKSSACTPAPPSPAPPSPSPPKPPSPSPPPMCNPATTKNITLYNPTDCKDYTLYDIGAECLVDWFKAKEVCEKAGMELAPHTCKDVLIKLCRDRGFTCWTGGKDSDLCPLMTAGGDIVKQGCNQPVRWVCRTKVGVCPLPSLPLPSLPPPYAPSPSLLPSYPPLAPSYPPLYPPSSYPPSPSPPSPLPPSPPPPPSPKPPSPSPPPMCNPATTKNTTLYNPMDCMSYTLYDIGAECLVDWFQAKGVCEKAGMELAPHTDGAAHGVLLKLCRDRSFTCWTGGRDIDLCPLMTAGGDIVKQGCNQTLRWVCRSKVAACTPAAPPSPQPPSPSPPASECRHRHGPPIPRMLYSLLVPGTPSFPAGCIDTCDVKYPHWAIWVCDKAGKPYKNWCYAACDGNYLTSPCGPPPGSTSGNSDVLTYMGTQYEYRMFVDTLLTYSKADEYCEYLGSGWGLVPYGDEEGWSAVRQMAPFNGFTCWLKRDSGDTQCPLVDAKGLLQKQGCEQDVRFVCRRLQLH
ncbi:hypothetical protein TSOC_006766 [Tetrabaena socialis]|uniref:Uncharacterized protein n=1 Tax=Tetrabaena socialis TaxID=47790 RepID=A0A2J8A2T7_9CHLO|nr:hypothetical protein TSOC_006766 [Tetrabaena socialis]|eukprot:PNH06823.1 hypothetical protein TSOC_006766 [Tetrabaena socialis]